MVESTTERLELRRELAIAARPETVWSFLVDPQKQLRWMGISAELDPRPGGVMRCEVIPGQVASGCVERTMCTPASAKRAKAVSASSV